ncbi:MAG: pantetheine-phosphate adenylyltransferase [Clostridia bacterium]|nr:pantetheine-phosphate adenylyltransferase [Clostridia bacterium]
MSSCVFPGSFDPVTAGHMDIISRASAIFDRVHVTVMVNVNKQGCFPAEDRVRLLQKACARYGNVEVDRWEGLLAEYMREHRERILIRGVRSCSEYEHEYTAALLNRRLNEQAETLLIPADPALSAVSSSAVREIAGFGGEIRGLVPDECLKDIQRMLSKKK